MTRAGNLDRVISWQRRLDDDEPDELGTMGTHIGAQAALRAQLVEQQQQEEKSHESGSIFVTALTFRLRYQPGMKPGDLVHYNGCRYQIAAIKELGRAAWLEITVKNASNAR